MTGLQLAETIGYAECSQISSFTILYVLPPNMFELTLGKIALDQVCGVMEDIAQGQ